MRYIKIFDNFNNSLNEEKKENILADGCVSIHHAKGSESAGAPPNDSNTTYFITSGDEMSYNQIDIEYNPSGYSYTMRIRGKDYEPTEFDDGKARIDFTKRDFKDIIGGGAFDNPSILAKSPQEATTKAYQILVHMSGNLTRKDTGNPKTMGNFIRALFGLRKLYPELGAQNPIFKAFLDGLVNSFEKPDFGIYKGVGNFPLNSTKDFVGYRSYYTPEFKKALIDAGVLDSKPATPAATPA